MLRQIVLLLVCCLLVARVSCTSPENAPAAGTMRVNVPAEAGALTISGEGFELVSRWSAPQTLPDSGRGAVWQFSGRETGSLMLAGTGGNLITDTFTAPGLLLNREVWSSDSGNAAAVRLTLTNNGIGPIRLGELVPLSCDSSNGLRFDNSEYSAWKILTQERLKNGHPGTFVPDTTLDLDSDPFMLIGGGATRLLIGFISQDYHIAGVRLHGSGGSQPRLKSLRAECEFDGVAVARGEKRASQWCYLSAGADENGLVTDFAERMARYRNIQPPPRNAPSVFCSWYYWGPWFSESDLVGQLDWMGRERVPFDVFLIDDCWSQHWGDWFPNGKWKSGMQHAAAAIHKAGYRAGIWTCPTLANDKSALAAEHPEWLLHSDDGSLLEFRMDGTNYVLDPTCPGVCDYIEDTYRRIVRDWNFDYLKLDFMRSVFVDRRVRFHDPSATRLEAYRRALEAVRAGAGANTYISVCGGHFGASLGIADSQRSGSDVVGFWRNIVPFKQNVLRTWMSRLWHVDADAMMVRREERARTEEGHGLLNVGKWTDTEARTVALNQYLCGNMVTFCEDFRRLDPDRRALYSHVIPSVNSAAIPLDLLARPCPSRFLTVVRPVAAGLKPWRTLALVNWTNSAQSTVARLDRRVTAGLESARLLVFDFFSQKVLGVFPAGAEIDLGELAPHQSALLRIAEWDGQSPVLAGTDLHFSGGGVEIGSWRDDGSSVSGTLNTGWDYPVKITATFPAGSGFEVRTVTLEPGKKEFRIEL